MIIARILRLAVLGHEHVLGPAQADALRAELARPLGVLGRVGVGAHVQAAHLVGPPQHRCEVLVDARLHQRHVVDGDPAPGPVDGDAVALVQLRPVDA